MTRGGPALSAGARGPVDVDRIATRLPFVVSGTDGGELRVVLDLDASAAGRFAEMLETLAVQLGA